MLHSGGKAFGFGIVGAGMIAHFHARAIHAMENATLLGIFSQTKEKSDAFALEHNCVSYSSLEEMLANDKIDIICICTPSGIHLEPAVQSLKAGKHCLVEKPLEVTLDRCDQIIAAAEQSGTLLGVIFPSRFSEVNKLVKQSLIDKKFGDVALADAYVKWHRTEAYYRSAAWRGTRQYDGGGALMNQGIHSVDLLQWFMGPVESISAFVNNSRHKNIEVEDTVAASLKFKNGALGAIECSTAIFPGSLKRIEICGTAGTAVVEENHLLQWEFADPQEGDAAIARDFAPRASVTGGASDPSAISFLGHQRQMENMIDAINHKEKIFIDGREGRKSVEIVLAIYESASSGNIVHLK